MAARFHMRQMLAAVALGMLFVSCGGDELSLPGYVEEMNEIVVDGRGQIEPLYEEYLRLEAPGVEDVRAVLEAEVTIRLGIQEPSSASSRRPRSRTSTRPSSSGMPLPSRPSVP